MARRNKGYAVPLDNFIKEKENTNRPIAARSAGTVGKWGKMGFTSTRTHAMKSMPSSVSLVADSATAPYSSTMAASPANSPDAYDDCQLTANEPPKPRKFFKYRNLSVQTKMVYISHLPRAPPSPIRPDNHLSPPKHEPPLKLKITKPKLERKKSLSVEKECKQPKKKKKEEKILKPEAPPSRVITRTRKVVNYNEEDDDRSETPLRDIIKRLSPVPVRKESPLAAKLELPAPIRIESETITSPSIVSAVEVPVIKTPSVEHPPIVLRISKGTSRLISTDSEEILNSPVHEPPQIDQPSIPVPAPEPVPPPTIEEPSPPPLKPSRIILRRDKGENEFTAEASPAYQPSETPVSQTPPVEPPAVKHESLKIVIKTNAVERPEKRSKSKRHHKTASGHKVITDHVFKTPSPQPGTENYDLYRTLTGSPSERDFDSQSSVLGSISSKENSQFPVAMADESCVIRSRGSSDITSDIETSQHSSLVAIPSDIESRLESMMDEEDPIPERISDLPNVSDRLGSIREEPLKEDILEVLTDGQERTKPESPAIMEPIIVNTKEPNAQNGLRKSDEVDGSSQVVDEAPVTTRRTRSRTAVTASTKAATAATTKAAMAATTKAAVAPTTKATVAANMKAVTATMKVVTATTKAVTTPTKAVIATTKAMAVKQTTEPNAEVEEIPRGRVTRNKNNGSFKNKKTEASSPAPAPTLRSYGRKRKAPPVKQFDEETDFSATQTLEASTLSIDLPEAPPLEIAALQEEPILDVPKPAVREYKIKNKIKRAWETTEPIDGEEPDEPPSIKSKYDIPNNTTTMRSSMLRSATATAQVINNNTDESAGIEKEADDEKRSVKLVISKKKGSIFKSRALEPIEQGNSTKRHVYKHTWDADKDKTPAVEDSSKPKSNAVPSLFEDDDFNDDEEPPSTSNLVRVTRPNVNNWLESETVTSVRCDKKAKEYITVVRNVKTAHQIQESGEYQEMDDDVEYLLDTMQPHIAIPTRCLSALQLASKCMTPGFRMHVRAHGTALKFFRALKDAKNDLSLSLCTATIMFVLSQDRLNMDLDRESLGLMLNLLESNGEPSSDDVSYERNKQRVKEICEEIKSQGKATHLNLDNISPAILAMETLLSLTSQRAGEWYKEELRKLGGLEHVIKTIYECRSQISDYVVSWTNVLLDKLRTIGRCLRVLENVTENNEENQKYILTYKKGEALNTLFKLFKLCDSEIALYPTSEGTPKQEPGVVLRETLVPLLKVLIHMTHAFNDQAIGAAMLGDQTGIFDTSFHILLQAPNYVPESCVFDLSILVLLLLINLTMHTVANRNQIMKAHAPSDFGNQFDKVPAIKALIEYFYNCERNARLAEENTNAILDQPAEKDKYPNTQEQLDETVTILLKKARHHMEHTMKASHAGMLIVYLIIESEANEKIIRSHLKDGSFNDIIGVLEKYLNFVSLTASTEATSHIKSTAKLIDYVKNCETHSTVDAAKTINSTASTANQQSKANNSSPPAPTTSTMATRSTPRVYKTYSQR